MIPVSEIDRKIIEYLRRNGRTTFNEIGRSLGISHVAVRKHYEKMVKDGLIKVTALINSRIYVYAIILAEFQEHRYLEEAIERLKDCPRIVFLAPLINALQYLVIMAFESLDTLESCMKYCIVRNMKGIRRTELMISNEIVYPTHIPLRITSTEREETPCGMNCSKCPAYRNGKCIACPTTIYYKKHENP